VDQELLLSIRNTKEKRTEITEKLTRLYSEKEKKKAETSQGSKKTLKIAEFFACLLIIVVQIQTVSVRVIFMP